MAITLQTEGRRVYFTMDARLAERSAEILRKENEIMEIIYLTDNRGALIATREAGIVTFLAGGPASPAGVVEAKKVLTVSEHADEIAEDWEYYYSLPQGSVRVRTERYLSN